MISTEPAIEIVRKFDFFQGQRAGRELWAAKPTEVQNVDLMSFSSDCGDLLEYLEKTQEPGYRLETIPEKCWIICDMPGFYDIYEYEVDRVSFVRGRIDKLWCHREHEGTVVTSHDLNRVVFFSKEAASSTLAELIRQRRGEVSGEV